METVTERLLHEERKIANKRQKKRLVSSENHEAVEEDQHVTDVERKGHIQKNCPNQGEGKGPES